jgi:hypothetical protein
MKIIFVTWEDNKYISTLSIRITTFPFIQIFSSRNRQKIMAANEDNLANVFLKRVINLFRYYESLELPILQTIHNQYNYIFIARKKDYG